MSVEWLFIGTVSWRTKSVTSTRLPHAQNYQIMHSYILLLLLLLLLLSLLLLLLLLSLLLFVLAMTGQCICCSLFFNSVNFYFSIVFGYDLKQRKTKNKLK